MLPHHTKLAQTLSQLLLNRIAQRKLSLSILPNVATRVQSALAAEPHNAQALTQAICHDPILVSCVLKTTQSALITSPPQVNSLEQAVHHLGYPTLRNTIESALAQRAQRSREPDINTAIDSLCEYCHITARLARDIADIAGLRDPNSAYTAGLLHNIGQVVVAIYLLDFERSLSIRQAMNWISHREWLELTQTIGQEISQALARYWHLPPPVQQLFAQPDEYDTEHHLSTVNAVIFAGAISKREGYYEGAYEAQAIDASILLGQSILSIEPDLLSGLLLQLHRQSPQHAHTT